MRVGLVVALLLMNALVAGCFGGKEEKNDAASDALPKVAVPLPILTMMVKVGNDTYNFTTAPAPTLAKAAGNATGNGTSSNTTTTTTTSNNGTGNQTAGNSTGNQTGGNSTGNATGNASLAKPTIPTGVVPVNVTFTLGVLNATGLFNWVFDAGLPAKAANATGNATGNSTGNSTSGNSTTTTSTGPSGNATGNGTGNATAPKTNGTAAGVTLGNTTNATITFTYNLTGNFTPTFRLTLANRTVVNLTATLLVAAPAVFGNVTNGTASGPRPLPDPATFTYGRSAGCVGDFGQCASRAAGPGTPASSVDGFWQALTEAYWGFLGTNTVAGNQLGDTDCQYFAADHTTVLLDGSNGGSECTGIVPANTAWLFLYSYAEPSTGMTFVFTEVEA